jgi:hypothetical protein
MKISDRLLPCLTFFKAGKSVSGVTNLAMQMSLVFWPQAARQSQEFSERRGVELMLEQFSETYKVPTGHLPPTKRFRPAAPQPVSHAA